MKYLTMKDWLVKSFTQQRDEWFSNQINQRMKEEPNNAWLKQQTAWSYYVYYYGSGVEIKDGELVESNYQTYEDILFLESDKSFYPCYMVDGIKYVKATLFNNEESNLDLWTIRLSGADDYSVSIDIIGEGEAREEWYRICNLDTGISESDVQGYYFSN